MRRGYGGTARDRKERRGAGWEKDIREKGGLEERKGGEHVRIQIVTVPETRLVEGCGFWTLPSGTNDWKARSWLNVSKRRGGGRKEDYRAVR